jgi:hypothetical protein
MPDTDTLFQLPLGEFTAARNALAASLKKAGRQDEAAGVKALPKPSVSAWAVNQVYWRHRATFDRLMASGAELRRAQISQLSGETADLRGPLQARRDALADLSRQAAAALAEAQHQPTPKMMRRITTTLEALATYGSSAGTPVAGRLVDDVDPPGFETLAALVPQTTGAEARPAGSSTVLPFRQRSRASPTPKRAAHQDDRTVAEEREAARRAAKAAVQAAERALRDTRAAAARAETALETAAARATQAEEARAEADTRLERAAADLASARQEARRVAADAQDAAQAVADAERALERAKDAAAKG